MQLKHKETGNVYDIVAGKILSPREAKKLDITASFLSIRGVNNEEHTSALIVYTKDGFYAASNHFEIINEGEDNGQGTV